jgi:hypothetical protein
MVDINVVKGGGRATPPSPAWAEFTLMLECTPESGHCYARCVLCGFTPLSVPKICLNIVQSYSTRWIWGGVSTWSIIVWRSTACRQMCYPLIEHVLFKVAITYVKITQNF